MDEMKTYFPPRAEVISFASFRSLCNGDGRDPNGLDLVDASGDGGIHLPEDDFGGSGGVRLPDDNF